ncbi:hypothetical protein TSUD_256930 [Trifolium subterraneum]|uniref:Uncharacterized protein n=1 Tax=Trifolium subterraneum TaxID=3900 RepID=A0A2Z6MXB5_TRISU|nr:hypothetical protein TSUD_256930 [Trifolium subterraneum]
MALKTGRRRKKAIMVEEGSSFMLYVDLDSLFLSSTFFSGSSESDPIMPIYVIECHLASARIEVNTETL